MNVKTYAKNFAVKMNNVKNVADANALVAVLVADADADIQVLNLMLAEISDLIDGQDASCLEQMVRQHVPAACTFGGIEIRNALWFAGDEYYMGTELVVPTTADVRAEFNASWEASLAEQDAAHARAVAEMNERHIAAVAAMRVRFN